MRKAIIDIGTNTFHLIIAEISKNKIDNIIYRESRYVRIAKEGYDPISEAAILRAENCLDEYVAIINLYQSPPLRIIATQALRSASNQMDVLDRLQKATQHPIDIINGEEEAKLVYKGCNQAIPDLNQDYLIMDIGGGSVEFIAANNQAINYLTSLKIGVQYLFSLFKPSDPIKQSEINQIYSYISDQSTELSRWLNEHNPGILVGTSGSFEILATLVNAQFVDNKFTEINPDQFYTCFQSMIITTLADRNALAVINQNRAELLICGLLVMKYWIDYIKPGKIIVSNYALREGALID